MMRRPLPRRCAREPGLLQAMRKHRDHTEFACWIRNATPQPLRLAVPFGEMERRPRMGEGELAELLERNRARYCAAAGDEAEAWGRAAARPRRGGFEIGEHEML